MKNYLARLILLGLMALLSLGFSVRGGGGGGLPTTGPIVIGTANTTSITLMTDGTGNDELVIPTNSIYQSEIVFNGITSNEISWNAIQTEEYSYLMFQSWYCGLGPNNSTEVFYKPMTEYSPVVLQALTDLRLGETFCDANQDTVIDNADEVEAFYGNFL